MDGQKVWTGLKYGIAGTIIGAATGVAADAIYVPISNMMMPSSGGSEFGAMGRIAASVISGVAISSTALIAGDTILSTALPGQDDPNFRFFFYFTAFMSMQSARQGAGLLQAFLRQMLNGAMTKTAPPSSTKPPMMTKEKPASQKSCCGK